MYSFVVRRVHAKSVKYLPTLIDLGKVSYWEDSLRQGTLVNVLAVDSSLVGSMPPSHVLYRYVSTSVGGVLATNMWSTLTCSLAPRYMNTLRLRTSRTTSLRTTCKLHETQSGR